MSAKHWFIALSASLTIGSLSVSLAEASVDPPQNRPLVETLTPEDELAAAQASAFRARDADLAATTEVLRLFVDASDQAVKDSRADVNDATTAFRKSRSMDDFSRLALARSSLDQASLVLKEAKALANEQVSTNRKSIYMVVERVIKPANLRYSYRKLGEIDNPCVVTYMGIHASVINEQVASLIEAREETWSTRVAGLEAFRLGLVEPYDAVARAEVERERARIAFAKDRSAANRAALKERSGWLKIMQQERRSAVIALDSTLQPLKKELTASAADRMNGTDSTVEQSLDLPSRRFAYCLDPDLFPNPDA